MFAGFLLLPRNLHNNKIIANSCRDEDKEKVQKTGIEKKKGEKGTSCYQQGN